MLQNTFDSLIGPLPTAPQSRSLVPSQAGMMGTMRRYVPLQATHRNTFAPMMGLPPRQMNEQALLQARGGVNPGVYNGPNAVDQARAQMATQAQQGAAMGNQGKGALAGYMMGK